jgi:hypothetical protein
MRLHVGAVAVCGHIRQPKQEVPAHRAVMLLDVDKVLLSAEVLQAA